MLTEIRPPRGVTVAIFLHLPPREKAAMSAFSAFATLARSFGAPADRGSAAATWSPIGRGQHARPPATFGVPSASTVRLPARAHARPRTREFRRAHQLTGNVAAPPPERSPGRREAGEHADASARAMAGGADPACCIRGAAARAAPGRRPARRADRRTRLRDPDRVRSAVAGRLMRGGNRALAFDAWGSSRRRRSRTPVERVRERCRRRGSSRSLPVRRSSRHLQAESQATVGDSGARTGCCCRPDSVVRMGPLLRHRPLRSAALPALARAPARV